MNHFIRTELNAEQQQYERSNQTSCFTAYMKNRYGHKAFVFALLQTGVCWSGGRAYDHFNAEGKEKIARRWVQWTYDLLKSIQAHQAEKKHEKHGGNQEINAEPAASPKRRKKRAGCAILLGKIFHIRKRWKSSCSRRKAGAKESKKESVRNICGN